VNKTEVLCLKSCSKLFSESTVQSEFMMQSFSWDTLQVCSY